MSFVPLQDNNPNTINKALEELHKILGDHSTQIASVEERVKVVEVPVQTTVISSEVTQYSVSMNEFYPSAAPMQGEYGIGLNWGTWAGYGSNEVLYYNIYISTDATCPVSDATLVAKNITASPYNLVGLSKSTTYYIRIVPVGTLGNGKSSEVCSATVLGSITSTLSSSDPASDGEIKLVPSATIEVSDCDLTTGWTVHAYSGTIPTLSIDGTDLKEGIGSLKITKPNTGTLVIKNTFAASDWSTYDYIKVWCKRNSNVFTAWPAQVVTLYFGEAAYNEQSMDFASLNADTWYELTWDISGIAAASKNAVTLFAIGTKNNSWGSKSLWIDDVRVTQTESLKVKFSDAVYTITVT
jgi:hypothetical protein